jgi:hypothetical protein
MDLWFESVNQYRVANCTKTAFDKRLMVIWPLALMRRRKLLKLHSVWRKVMHSFISPALYWQGLRFRDLVQTTYRFVFESSIFKEIDQNIWTWEKESCRRLDKISQGQGSQFMLLDKCVKIIKPRMVEWARYMTCMGKLKSSPWKASGYYVYHLRWHPKTLHSSHRVYLCVPYGSHNKQRLFP